MKAARIAAATLAAALLSMAAQAGQRPGIGPDHGRFRIFLNGRAVGTEDFTISRNGNGWSARSSIQLHMPGKTQENDTAQLTLAADGSPIRYRWQRQSAHSRSIEVNFRGNSAEMTLRQPASAPAIEAFSFPAGHVVLLDNNVYSQYAILARLYDWKAGEKQQFSVLIPQDQAPGTVTVQSMGKRSIAGATFDLLTVKSPDLEVDLYVDAARRLMLLRVPGSGAEIARE
jgi:hypothetical protein